MNKDGVTHLIKHGQKNNIIQSYVGFISYTCTCKCTKLCLYYTGHVHVHVGYYKDLQHGFVMCVV